MSDRIDHVAEAEELLAASVQSSDENAAIAMLHTKAAAAQAHAMLALVEQQRIANLIALSHGARGGVIGLEDIALDALRSLNVSSDGPWGNQTVELLPEIREALGLRE